MWCPGMAGIICLRFFKEPVGNIGFNWNKTSINLLSFLFPLLYMGIAYGLIWSLGLARVDYEFIGSITDKMGMEQGFLGLPMYLITLALFGMGNYLFAATGEELGWRGYLLKKLLVNNGRIRSSLIVGIIWAVWHFPLFHVVGLEFNLANWFLLSNFFGMVIGLSFIYTWFYLRSQNIWTSALLHTSHNMFLQRFFTALTLEDENSYLYTDETGVMLMLVTVSFGIIMIARRKMQGKHQ